MNNELKHLITLVKTSQEPVQTVVDAYMKAIVWSTLKHEYSLMSKQQKKMLILKLEQERK